MSTPAQTHNQSIPPSLPEQLVVTIDGPSASGKTTVAQRLAKRHGLTHIMGGTFLRSFAYFVLTFGINANDQGEVISLLEKFDLEVVEGDEDSDTKILINGVNSREHLWTPEVDSIVGRTSQHAQVRAARVAWKRRFAQGKRIVADGRTLGSEVFPWADIKIHLTSSLEVRAKRRFSQYALIGKDIGTVDDVRSSIERRDSEDSFGEIDRTRIFPDQHVIDSTKMSADDVVMSISEIVKARFEESA